MKVKIILDEEEIAKLIAEKFSIPREDVKLEVRAKHVGFGMSEEEVHYVACEVNTDWPENCEK